MATIYQIKAVDGRHLHITDDPDAYRQLVKEGKIALTGAEIDAVKRTGATQAQAAVFLDIKEVFGGTIRPGMQLDPEKVWQFEI